MVSGAGGGGGSWFSFSGLTAKLHTVVTSTASIAADVKKKVTSAAINTISSAATTTAQYARSAKEATFSAISSAATTSAQYTSDVGKAALKWTGNIFVNSVMPGVAKAAEIVHKGATILQKGTEVVGILARNWDTYIDHENQIEKSTIIEEADIRESYAKVKPHVAEDFYKRFGAQTMRNVDDFVTLAHNGISESIDKKLAGSNFIASTVSSFKESFTKDRARVGLQTASLGCVTWVSDKLKSALPNDDAKAKFAAETAKDVNNIVQLLDQVAITTREQTNELDWGDSAFRDVFNARLAETDFAKRIKTPEEFYKKLADKLLVRLERELPKKIDDGLGKLIMDTLKVLDEQQIYPREQRVEFVADILKSLHKQITDPIRIKQWMSVIFDNVSGSMEGKFDAFTQRFDGVNWWVPFAEFFTTEDRKQISSVLPKPYDKSYGQAIMGTLQILQPLAFGANVLQGYRSLVEGRVEDGSDLISVILRDNTGACIETLMASNTDGWIPEAIRIAKMNLLERVSQQGSAPKLIDRPYYVPEEEWKNLIDEDKRAACNPASVLAKKFKKEHEKKINEQFLTSCKRIAKSTSRAALVVEQFLPTVVSIATDKKNSWYERAVAYVGGIIMNLPIIHFIINVVHRLSVAVRTKIADSISEPTGQSIAGRMDQFLATNSISLLTMEMMEKTLERLEIIDKEEASEKSVAKNESKKLEKATAKEDIAAKEASSKEPLSTEKETVVIATVIDDRSDSEEDEIYVLASDGDDPLTPDVNKPIDEKSGAPKDGSNDALSKASPTRSSERGEDSQANSHPTSDSVDKRES